MLPLLGGLKRHYDPKNQNRHEKIRTQFGCRQQVKNQKNLSKWPLPLFPAVTRWTGIEPIPLFSSLGSGEHCDNEQEMSCCRENWLLRKCSRPVISHEGDVALKMLVDLPRLLVKRLGQISAVRSEYMAKQCLISYQVDSWNVLQRHF